MALGKLEWKHICLHLSLKNLSFKSSMVSDFLVFSKVLGFVWLHIFEVYKKYVNIFVCFMFMRSDTQQIAMKHCMAFRLTQGMRMATNQSSRT